MIKAAIEKIQEMAEHKIQDVNGRTFFFHGHDYDEIQPEVFLPELIELNSLDAMVKMVKTEAMKKFQAPFYITIPSPTNVHCFAQPEGEDKRFVRARYYTAMATDVPGWKTSEQMNFEEAMIALRTRFQDTEDTIYALKLLSDITTGSKVTYNDNGIATSVVTRKGIDLQTNAPIKPIVSLRPYRTFQEVEQPASDFLIRINDRGILFTEADGGMWKLTARNTIKNYFEAAFTKEIQDGTVVVML